MNFLKPKKEMLPPAWATEIQEVQQRFFLFLEKLEAKVSELCEAAIPELIELNKNDPDVFKRAYNRFKSSVIGQIKNIRQKAYDVRAEKILDFCSEITINAQDSSSYHDLLRDFKSQCANRYQLFEDNLEQWSHKIEATSYEDLEIKYQKILKEYEEIKGKFKCTQCGSPVVIDKIFFIDVYVACLSCQTQNSFAPSTQARMLQHFAQELAEQRTAHLREAYLDAKRKELKQTTQETLKLYEQYVRTKYSEWKKITPDQAEHLEKRMQNDLASMRQ